MCLAVDHLAKISDGKKRFRWKIAQIDGGCRKSMDTPLEAFIADRLVTALTKPFGAERQVVLNDGDHKFNAHNFVSKRMPNELHFGGGHSV